jgi:hypothetical protein
MRSALLLGLVCLLGSTACGGGGRETSSRLESLSSSERASLDEFVAAVRGGFERGDSRAVESLIELDGVPDFIANLTASRALPKGPMKVTEVRVEPVSLAEGPLLVLEGVEYGFNVDPVGTLVIEMDDVSIGATRVELIFGTRDGAYRLAALEAKE